MKLIFENWKHFLLEQQSTLSESDTYFNGLLDRLPERSISIIGKKIAFSKFAEEKGVKGYISLAPIQTCNGAFKVHWVEATKGWGSLLYELAIERTGQAGFIADRESTTSAALAVWNRIMTQRPDLTKTPININGGCSLNVLHHYFDKDLNFNPQINVERTRVKVLPQDNLWLQFKKSNPEDAAKYAAQTPFGNIITKPNPSVLQYGLKTKKIVEGAVY
jgi:hypothetical protein